MHKAKNIYFLLIKKKRDGPRHGVAQGKIPSPIAWQRKNYSIIEIFCAIWEDQRPTIKCKTLSLLSLSLDLSLEATNQFVHIVYKNQKNRIKRRFGSTRIRNKKKEGNLYPEGGQRPEGWTGLRAVARSPVVEPIQLDTL